MAVGSGCLSLRAQLPHHQNHRLGRRRVRLARRLRMTFGSTSTTGMPCRTHRPVKGPSCSQACTALKLLTLHKYGQRLASPAAMLCIALPTSNPWVELRTCCRRRMPEHMQPSYVVWQLSITLKWGTECNAMQEPLLWVALHPQ